jgi:hypothetical protein
MALQHLGYVLALLIGITSSAIIASLWQLITDEDLKFSDLMDPDPDFFTPFRALAVIFSAPSRAVLNGFQWTIAQPLIGLIVLALGLGWSFLQGVFILTTLLGFP